MHTCISGHLVVVERGGKWMGGKRWQLFVCLLTRKETLCKDAEIIAKGHMNCKWDSRQWRGGIEKKDIIKRVMRLFCLFQFSIFFNPSTLLWESCPRDSCYLSVCFCIPFVYQCLCIWLHLCFGADCMLSAGC